MVSDDVTRRGVMKGVGVMTGIGFARSGASGVRRDSSGEIATDPVRSSVDSKQESWPQSGGTAVRTGRRTGAIGPKSTIVYRWRVSGNPAISSVVIDDHIVYASDETTLRALSAEDGSEVWTRTGTSVSDDSGYGTTSMSTPAIDNALVYVGETRKRAPSPVEVDKRSRILALDAATGVETWRFEPEQTASGFYAPTVADSVVYVIGRNYGAGSVGYLYALDGATGDLLWTRETGGSGIAGYEAPPVAVENGVVYLASDTLLALDAQTGETYWSNERTSESREPRTYRGIGNNAPAVADGRLYIGHGHSHEHRHRHEPGSESTTTFEARNTADGSLAWTYTVTSVREAKTKTKTKTNKDTVTDSNSGTGTGIWTGAAVDDDTVYVGLNWLVDGMQPSVYAFAADDGTVRWQTAFGSDRLSVYTPAIADGVLYTGGAALRLDDGSICWRLDTPSNPQNQTLGFRRQFSQPAVADETVYVGGATLRAITGR